MSIVEKAKRIAAYRAIDEYIKPGMRVGIGSGSTVVYAVERLAKRVQMENMDIVCVPTSFQAKQLITKYALKLGDLDTTPELDLCVDGADEVDANLNLIKGGGGCLLGEKIVAFNSKKLVIIADYTKDSQVLGEKWERGIPIEVLPHAWVPIKQRIEKLYKGKLDLRMATEKAGPCVTDYGNFLLDWKHFDKKSDWRKVNNNISLIPGIVETGLFIEMAEKVFFGMEDGSVKEVNGQPRKTPCKCH